ncbi:MAG: aspartate:alanine exchanger family transporter [Verrucomicrobiales bacterium]
MDEWLLHFPVARLFAIIALGYLLGEIKFPGGFRLGVSGVLFVGLALGAWRPGMEFSPDIQTLGLVLFVYCIGLQAAPEFFKSFKKEGLRLNLAVVSAFIVTFVGCYFLLNIKGVSPALLAGIFTGALTNTPALGAVTESLTRSGASAEATNHAVIGYGVAYPIAIIVVLLAIQALSMRKSAKKAESTEKPSLAPPITIVIEKMNLTGAPFTAEQITRETGVLLTRYRTREGKTGLVDPSTPLPSGSSVVAIGTTDQVNAAAGMLGEATLLNLHEELRGFKVHRYFVSNRKIAERPLGELGLWKIGAVVSRLRRGDIDLPVNDQTVLHLGDRVRVVSYQDKEPEVRKFFGNNVTHLSETGYFSFGIGIILGFILGHIPIPIPGLAEPVRLGHAGGPLVVALVLGSLGRTGPFIWSIPNEVNLTLRHLGILFFLAAVGVKAGRGLLGVLQTDAVLVISLSLGILALAHIPFLTALYLCKQRDLSTVLGSLSGFQTQPAALGFAASKAPAGPLNTAYAAVYPLAVILKIILAQLIAALK